ncbi:glycosyltransferase family 4 protein [Streptomyces sp. NBC_00237]|uniref:glycosyltransferase family 4 protein n=1 Tax=Streptomyces sp. NBC_00237 TaxID=2975687 RepID=UPI00224FE2CE|nr:glycosyltransferase family 4 protein [Streptomyces sp. NBC_00237]MCX5202162.1 glycosyltransferase family 4 protein [Streptomyces sp. NBC_00237]
MHISFLLHNAYAVGGTIRTTFNLAQTLAEQHDVEITSVFRHRDEPSLSAPAGVRLEHLVDLREKSPHYDGDHPDHQRPAVVFPAGDSRHHQYSRLTDRRIGAHLSELKTDVVVGTRPGLNVHLARQARHDTVRVGQEHLTLDSHRFRLRRELRYRYALLDAVTTVTQADALSYRERLKLPGVRIEAMANSVPAARLPPSDGSGKWVIAAGRLTPGKRYDLLVRAFAQVVAARPDWRLRIYGGGDGAPKLRALVHELRLHNHVFLMGVANPLEAEWPKGSIAAVTSDLEAFGMTIVEAMRCGLPVVSTDCPHGPREIIRDGVDGRLVPVGDANAVARALLDLIQDDGLRHRMGRAALADTARFDPAEIAERHAVLYAELVAQGSSSRSRSALRDALHRAPGVLVDEAFTLRRKVLSTLRKGRTA